MQSFEVSNLKYLKDQLDLHKTLKHAQIIQLYDAKTSRPADFVESGVSKTYGDLATAQSLKDVAKYANGVGPSKTIFSISIMMVQYKLLHLLAMHMPLA